MYKNTHHDIILEEHVNKIKHTKHVRMVAYGIRVRMSIKEMNKLINGIRETSCKPVMSVLLTKDL